MLYSSQSRSRSRSRATYYLRLSPAIKLGNEVGNAIILGTFSTSSRAWRGIHPLQHWSACSPPLFLFRFFASLATPRLWFGTLRCLYLYTAYCMQDQSQRIKIVKRSAPCTYSCTAQQPPRSKPLKDVTERYRFFASPFHLPRLHPSLPPDTVSHDTWKENGAIET